MASARILVVEDERLIARDLQQKLQGFGYDVPVTAHSGVEALAQAVATRPDLVLMDIRMNGDMDGIEAAREIHKQLDVPIIYLTAYSDEVTYGRAMATEPFGYLLKPFEELELHINIQTALYKHRMEKALRDKESWLAATLNSIGEAVVTADQQGHLTLINPAAEALSGWQQEAAAGKPVGEVFRLIGGEARAPIEDPVNAAIEGATQVSLPTDTLLLDQVGGTTSVAGGATPILDAAGAPAGAVLVLRDVTEKRRQEEALRHRMAEIDALNRLGRRVGATLSVEQVAAAAMIEIVEPIDPDVGVFFRRRGEQLELLATHPSEHLQHRDGIPHKVGQCLCGLAVAEGKALFSQDIRTDPRCSLAECKQAGLTSFTALPLRIGDQTLGVLGLAWRKTQEFEGRAAFFEAVSNQISTALHNALLHSTLQEHATAVEEQKERWQELFNRMSSAVVVYTAVGDGEDFLIRDINPAGEQITRVTRDEVIDRRLTEVFPAIEQMGLLDVLRRVARSGEPEDLPAAHYEDEVRSLWAKNYIYRLSSGEIVAVFDDISAQKEAEARNQRLSEQLLHSQKLEAVGQLAGGVAHDFNNLLMVINGTGELLLSGLDPTSPLRHGLQEMCRAGDRAAALTRQLLAFSRRQALNPQVLDLAGVIHATEKMLQRVIGEDVVLTTALAPGTWYTRADPGQVEQVIMNLALNARDAMPQGGRLTVETRNVKLDASHDAVRVESLPPGDYISLSVSDTGTGMTPEALARAFEPFFTTKGPGRGTGLGLAVVHGIIRQSGGAVRAYSAPGHGSTFTVYLPRCEEEPAEDHRARKDVVPQGTETMLLVEDEAAVRKATRLMLETCGYRVLDAASGEEALALAASYPDPIHLLLTDVVMPGMGGVKLAEALTAERPEVKVLCMSGYADDAVMRHGILDPGFAFLNKPFTRHELARKIRTLLDDSQSTGVPRG